MAGSESSQRTPEKNDSDQGDALSRRTLVKSAGAVAATGALGTLAGCTGGGSGNGGNGSGNGGNGSGNGGNGSGNGGGGGQETVNLEFVTGFGAENNATREHFKKGMKNYESMKGKVNVDLNFVSYGDIKAKLPARVQAGNPPELAESGSAGIPFYLNDQVVDHKKYLSETDLPEKWGPINATSAKYRGEWWSGGSLRASPFLLAVRPKLFKQAGVNDPSQLTTWTGYRRALEKVKKEFPDAYPHEVTGVSGDLECYWNAARTAWTGGTDPWVSGEKPWTNFKDALKVGRNERTDGMIKNTLDLAESYSSPSAATRGDEDIPSLMLTDRVGAFLYGLGSPNRWKAVADDVTFGWDGDIYETVPPKLDPNYGNEFGIQELAGHEGSRGGFSTAFEQQQQVFKTKNADQAWDLNKYVVSNSDFVAPLLGKVYTSRPTYQPIIDAILDEYGAEMTQIQQVVFKQVDKYLENYGETGSTWGVPNVNQLRWDEMNKTISQGIAGQHPKSKVPGIIRQRMTETVE